MTHLRLAHAPEQIMRDALINIIRACPKLMDAFVQARALNLPDWWIVSGAIKRSAAHFQTDIPVKVRNQARVHLWYADHFGTTSYPQLTKSSDGIDDFASTTHGIGMRLNPGDSFAIYAPLGLRDIFTFMIAPHLKHDNNKTHASKTARQKAVWPKLTVIPWPT